MGFFRQLVRHPQQLWIRRLSFRIHLFIGILLALYAIVIGVTGSILVFGAELNGSGQLNSWPALPSTQPKANLATVIDALIESYPHTHIVSVMAPSPGNPVFTCILQKRKRTTIACDPLTGRVLGELPRTTPRLAWIYDLHENLLARRSGRIVNGAASALMLLMACTGLVNWWPGIRNVRRAVSIDFRRTWKRVNFDLHSAVGFWSLLIVTIWATSGIYFTWPDKFIAVIGRFSPIVSARPPVVVVDSYTEILPLEFHAMLSEAKARDPGMQVTGIVFPSGPRSPLEILMARAQNGLRDHEDTLYFNPYDGRYMSMWRYGVNRTLGDWIIWLQIPLHFGTHWGIGIKLLWATFGLAMPLLAITGLVMYWNRVLGKRWQRLPSM